MANELGVLTEIGLEEREARTYLVMLRLGSATAAAIAEETGIDRTTTYDVLNRLIKKGTASYIIKSGVKYFLPINPEQLLKNLQEKEADLEGIMSGLTALAKKDREKTHIEIFNGVKAVKYVTEMVLRDKNDYLFIGAGHEFCEIAPIWVYKLVKEAYRLGLRGKMICEKGFGDHDADIVGKNETYRIISKEFTSTTTMVWGDKTAFFILESPYYSILIENKQIADRHRLYFNYLWKHAKEPTEEHRRKTLIKD